LGVGLLDDLVEHTREMGGRLPNNIWLSLYIVVVNYIFFEYTLPRLRWSRFGRTFLLIIMHLFLYSKVLFWWRKLGIGIGLYTSYADLHLSDMMGISMSSLVIFAIIRYIYNHNQLKQRAQQLQIEKQQAELNYLKSQTNPHFLFNTLNNIYSLARDKSDQAPETILRL